jgi:hypothetical protein
VKVTPKQESEIARIHEVVEFAEYCKKQGWPYPHKYTSLYRT